MGGIRIINVGQEPDSLNDFTEIPYKVYAKDPHWIPEDTQKIRDIIGRSSPLLSYCDIENFIALQNDNPVARVSAIINRRVKQERTIGYIGYFEALQDFTDSAVSMLEQAIEWLRGSGVEVVIGPLNVNTWNRYRFVIESSGRIPFFMEPYNPEYYNDIFLKADFTIRRNYFSAIFPLNDSLAALEKGKDDLPKNYSVRSFAKTHFKEEIKIIYKLSVEIFADNPEYTSIDWEEFWNLYNDAESVIEENLIKFVLDNKGNEVAFAFGIPDYFHAMRSMGSRKGWMRKLLFLANRRKAGGIILKSMGVLPAHRSLRLGSFLTRVIHREAMNSGYQYVIHALMEEDNYSRRLLGGGEMLRRYALYERSL